MAAEPLILTADIQAAGRTYTLYKGLDVKAKVSFSIQKDTSIDAVIHVKEEHYTIRQAVARLADALYVVERELTQHTAFASEGLSAFGIKIVAPGGYFLEHRFIDDEVTRRLKQLSAQPYTAVQSELAECKLVQKIFAGIPIFAVSDSALHAHKPDVAWNYDINLSAADDYDIKRFGYDGIAIESVIQMLGKQRLLVPKLLVCKLGETSSVTAIKDGQSIDTTTGYSLFEGVISHNNMGAISPAAFQALQSRTDVTTLDGGIHGISGSSSSIMQLQEQEKAGDHRARLALDMYIYSIQKAIGQMSAVLGGADLLIFTGDIAAQTPNLRKRIIEPFDYLGFAIDDSKNNSVNITTSPQKINQRTRVKQIYVLQANESYEIAWRTRKAILNLS